MSGATGLVARKRSPEQQNVRLGRMNLKVLPAQGLRDAQPSPLVLFENAEEARVVLRKVSARQLYVWEWNSLSVHCWQGCSGPTGGKDLKRSMLAFLERRLPRTCRARRIAVRLCG